MVLVEGEGAGCRLRALVLHGGCRLRALCAAWCWLKVKVQGAGYGHLCCMEGAGYGCVLCVRCVRALVLQVQVQGAGGVLCAAYI